VEREGRRKERFERDRKKDGVGQERGREKKGDVRNSCPGPRTW